MREFIESKKSEILQKFTDNMNKEFLHSEVNFTLEPLSSDPHNGGKTVQKIVFTVNDKPFLNLVCKPRSSAIDMIIMDLFSKFNGLQDIQTSSSTQLPCVCILDFSKENMSIWEYIEGDKISAECLNLLDYIEKLSNQQEQEALKAQLSRLESVCRTCCISDLHVENILIQRKDGQIKIFLIDLESIQKKLPLG